MVLEEESKTMTLKVFSQKLLMISAGSVFITMCTPPEQSDVDSDLAEQARLDSIRKVRCPRIFSSAAEFYKNRDWGATVRAYDELTDLGCDRDDPQEVYLYYAIAYEYMGNYDSSEYVLLKGLSFLPDNIDLRKRLAFAYEKQGKTSLQMDELDRLSFLSPEDIKIKRHGKQFRKDNPSQFKNTGGKNSKSPYTDKQLNALKKLADEIPKLQKKIDETELQITELEIKAKTRINEAVDETVAKILNQTNLDDDFVGFGLSKHLRHRELDIPNHLILDFIAKVLMLITHNYKHQLTLPLVVTLLLQCQQQLVHWLLHRNFQHQEYQVVMLLRLHLV